MSERISYIGNYDEGLILIGEKEASYCRDKKQNVLMCKVRSDKFKKGWKMFYADSPNGLVYQIDNRLNKNP